MSSTTGTNRRAGDIYYTPDDLADALTGLLNIGLDDVVWEPHAGGGAFVRAALTWTTHVLASDVDPAAPFMADERCSGAKRWTEEFLSCAPALWFRPDVIIGNPPFRDFEAHVSHALRHTPRVAFLLRLAAMESKKRVEIWRRWPLSRVYVLAERPSFTGGGTDSCPYGWFIFDGAERGHARIFPGWAPERTERLLEEVAR